MLKKSLALALGMVLLFTASAFALTAEEFEMKFQGFMAGVVSAEDFNTICDEALSLPKNLPEDLKAESEHNIYRYKYLALVKMENYYDAYQVADLMENKYGDAVGACEMLISLNRKRENMDAALAAAVKGEQLYRAKGLKPIEFTRANREIQAQKAKTIRVSAEELWQAFATDATAAKAKFGNAPVVVSGNAVFRQDEANKAYYVVFDVTSNGETKYVSCQIKENEVPFIQNVNFPAQVEMHGRFADISDTTVLMTPCFFIK